jgi:hypothetical protein
VGIWIRSQNKGFLVNTSHIEVEGTGKEGEWWVSAMDVDTTKNISSNVLGDYKTEDRALQVLDEIQAHIKEHENNLMYNLVMAGKAQYDSTWPVFDMPAE